MDTERRVVVVDGLPETEQVLKAVLEPRGIAVSRTRRFDATDHQPSQLLVLHQEAAHDSADTDSAASWPTTPAVIIGKTDLPVSDASVPGHCRLLSHPFHYAELVNAIDRLLESPADNGEPAAAA